MGEVFISYCSEDVAVVESIETALRGAGLDVWRDKSRLRAGQQFGKEIQAALDQARCVIVCLSRAAVESRWVEAECEHARNRLVPVIIAQYESTVRTHALFGQLHARDLRAWCDGANDTAFHELLADVNAMLGRPILEVATRRASMAATSPPPSKSPRVNVSINRGVGIAINFVQDHGRVDIHSDDPSDE